MFRKGIGRRARLQNKTERARQAMKARNDGTVAPFVYPTESTKEDVASSKEWRNLSA